MIVIGDSLFSSEPSVSDSLLASVNDYSPVGLDGARLRRVTPLALGVAITGLAGGVDGRLLLIDNMSTLFSLLLVNESLLSSARNRFSLPDLVNLSMSLNSS